MLRGDNHTWNVHNENTSVVFNVIAPTMPFYTRSNDTELRCNARCGWIFFDAWGQPSKIHEKHREIRNHDVQWGLIDKHFIPFVSLGANTNATDGQLVVLSKEIPMHKAKV